MLQCEARESNLSFGPWWAGSSVLSPRLGRSASGLRVMFKTLGEIAVCFSGIFMSSICVLVETPG